MRNVRRVVAIGNMADECGGMSNHKSRKWMEYDGKVGSRTSLYRSTKYEVMERGTHHDQ